MQFTELNFLRKLRNSLVESYLISFKFVLLLL